MHFHGSGLKLFTVICTWRDQTRTSNKELRNSTCISTIETRDWCRSLLPVKHICLFLFCIFLLLHIIITPETFKSHNSEYKGQQHDSFLMFPYCCFFNLLFILLPNFQSFKYAVEFANRKQKCAKML